MGLIAVAISSDEIDKDVVSSITGIFGNSSLLWPVNLYLPSPADISMPKFSLSILNVTGISEKVFNVSIKIFAGIATIPGSSDFVVGMVTVIVVSRSDAVIDRSSSFS